MEQEGIIRRFYAEKATSEGLRISHHIFADDTIIFCDVGSRVFELIWLKVKWSWLVRWGIF